MAIELKLQNWHESAILDDELTKDFALVHNEKWWLNIKRKDDKIRFGSVWTESKIARERGRRYRHGVRITLAQVALGKYGVLIDHKDRNPLNNLRSNLRICSWDENSRNIGKQSGAYTSKYKGVYFRKVMDKWVARIEIDRKVIHLGNFKSEDNAALAYNVAAKKYHGEFAFLNLVPEASIAASDSLASKISLRPENSLEIYNDKISS